MTKRVFFWTTAILAALCAAIPAWGAEESVVASRFGYDPQDATEALQSAIDSGAKRVVIDRQDSPWILRPIRLRGDLEVILEEGVELLAKKGEFRELVATTSLTPETFARLFPGEAARYVKPVPLDATFLTSSEGETLAQAWHDRAVAATPLRLRGSACYFVWLDEGEEGVLFLRQHKIGSYPPLPVEVAATEPDGSRVEYEPKVAVDSPLEVKLPKGTKGWRIVDAEFGPSFVTLEKSEGIVLTSAAPKADVFGSTGTFDFYVPETSKELSLRVVGSVAERVTARLYDPDGEEVSTLNDVDSLAVWTSPLDATGNPVKPKPEKAWSIKSSYAEAMPSPTLARTALFVCWFLRTRAFRAAT